MSKQTLMQLNVVPEGKLPWLDYGNYLRLQRLFDALPLPDEEAAENSFLYPELYWFLTDIAGLTLPFDEATIHYNAFVLLRRGYKPERSITAMDTQKAKRIYQFSYDYAKTNRPDELEWGQSISANTFKNLTARQFLEEYCWVVYAAGFKVKIIEQKFSALQKAFQDFDLHKLAKMESPDEALRVFNNRRKAEGFLKGAKAIHREGFARFKARVEQEGMAALKALPGIGEITQKHLAKNIGLTDVPKDDIWLERIARLCNASNVNSLTEYLADEFGETQNVVDLVLWRFCADNAWKPLGFDSLEAFLNS